jgi:hypothetical protein
VRVEEPAFVVGVWPAYIPCGGESLILCDFLVARDPLFLFLDASGDLVLRTLIGKCVKDGIGGAFSTGAVVRPDLPVGFFGSGIPFNRFGRLFVFAESRNVYLGPVLVGLCGECACECHCFTVLYTPLSRSALSQWVLNSPFQSAQEPELASAVSPSWSLSADFQSSLEKGVSGRVSK